MKLDRIIAVRNHKTVYRDGELCMKVFDETYSKADILAEAMNQARVEETGLHIPQVREVTAESVCRPSTGGTVQDLPASAEVARQNGS